MAADAPPQEKINVVSMKVQALGKAFGAGFRHP
jgi:hypothetical protein